MSRSDIEHVRDILDCIEAIDRAEATVRRYPGDLDVAQVALDAVRHRVFAIGEAVTSLSLELREDHPAVSWSDMERLGDLLDRDDTELDTESLRATIGESVRRLGAACRAILGETVRAGEDEP